MKDFHNKVAVITGAGSGFGREFARLGARLGMRLTIADVQLEALEAVRQELEEAGAEVIAVRCDVQLAEEVEALAEQTMAHFGAIHLLFNNAGVGSGGLLWENSRADWEWVLGVNLWGVIHGVRVFTPLMLAQGEADPEYQGHIVNTASMAGLLNAPAMGVYNVSKHAVVSLSETLYHDLRLVDAPIGASVLCPYFVPTGISKSARNRPEQSAQEAPTPSQRAAQALVEKAVSSGRVSAEDVAQWTFDAIRENRFYIYSHPEALGNVKTRMDAILAGDQPGDPYAGAPEIWSMLKSKLKS